MGGQYRSNLEPFDDVGDHRRVDIALDDAIHRRIEASRLDPPCEPVLLFRYVRQIEVGTEGPYEVDRRLRVAVVEQRRQLSGRLVTFASRSEPFGQGSDLFHEVEQIMSVVSRQRLPEQPSQQADVRPQRGVR